MRMIRSAARVLYCRVIFPTAAITAALFVNYYVQVTYLQGFGR